MKKIKCLSIVLLLFCMLILNGCWNYRELDALSMVAGFAVDKGTAGHKYHITIEILDLTKNQTGSKLLETEGDTVFDGIRNVISESQKKLFFSDCKVIVISQDVAKEGVSQVFDWITRDAEPRITVTPVISKAKTAAELLRQKPVTDQLISMEISKTLAQNATTLSQEPNVKIYEANNILATEGVSLILPAAKVEKAQDGENMELDGCAIFRKDKFLGFLDRYETNSLLCIKNQMKGGLILTSPDSSESKVALEVFESKTKVTPEIKGDSVTMHIDVKVKAALGEDNTDKNYLTPDGIKKVEKSAGKTLETNLTNVIKKVQSDYDSDVFGFGTTLSQNAPDFWKKEKAKWDDTFRTLKCTVTADVSVTNSASLNTNIKVG